MSVKCEGCQKEIISDDDLTIDEGFLKILWKSGWEWGYHFTAVWQALAHTPHMPNLQELTKGNAFLICPECVSKTKKNDKLIDIIEGKEKANEKTSEEIKCQKE